MTDRTQPPRIVDQPQPCFVRLRLVRGGPWVAARILRRLGMLTGEANGAPCDVYQIWHGGEVITEAAYNDMMTRPADDPRATINLREMKPLF